MTETIELQKGFPIPESRLVGRLGLSRHALQQLRQSELTHVTDWLVIKKRVMWSELALEKVLAKIGSKKNAPLPASARIPPIGDADTSPTEKNAPLPASAHSHGNTETLAVVSRARSTGYHFPNKKVIRGKRENGELVVVHVGDSRNFAPLQSNGRPMVVRARLEQGQDYSRWVLVGRRPRYRGRY